MLRQGPLPRFAFGLLEYALAILLIAAPFLFSYDSGSAVAASIIAGVLLLVLTASSDGPTGLVKSVPLAASLVFEVLLALVFIAAPFLFGFRDEGAPTAVFIIAGIVFLLAIIATRFTRGGEQKPA